MENAHLGVAGWAQKITDGSKFIINDTAGISHPLVLCSGMHDSKKARSPILSLLQWRNRTFGHRSILTALEKSLTIEFNIEDQAHWFNDDRTEIILQPENTITIVDTMGRRQRLYKPKALTEANKMEAFLEWREYLCNVALRLMGIENLKEDYCIRPDPTWSLADAKGLPCPIRPHTQLDDFDWQYDADPYQGFDAYAEQENELEQE